jgi:hypothetical protein
MHLTWFSDYTLRTLIYLGLRSDQLCTIDEIAGAYDISANSSHCSAVRTNGPPQSLGEPIQEDKAKR